MPSLRLSNPFRRGAERPSLKQRAAALRATAAKVMRRPTAAFDDPFEGRSAPPGFVPYPFEAPVSWANIRCVLKNEGGRLLRLAVGELDRRLRDCADRGFSADEIRTHEARLRRRLHIDALMTLAGDHNPDAELLRLGDELVEAWGREGDDGLDEVAFSAAFARTGAIVDRICALSPATLDGLIVKAIAVSWCHSGDTVTGESFDEHPSTDMHLCASIVRDLLTIWGGPSLPRSAGA